MRPVTLLVNPAAGAGRGAHWGRRVAGHLRAQGAPVTELVGRDPAEALELAHRAVASGVPLLAAVGGDGQVHLAVQALAGSDTALGVIPIGTGNDVARYLRVPRRDPLAAADLLLTGHRRTIDLARVTTADGATPRHFVTVLAAGFDAIVNERANQMLRPRGQMRYNLATLAELRTLRPIDYVLTLEDPRRELSLSAVTVAVGNGPSFGGGLRIAEGARLDDGLLDVVVIGPLTRRGLVRAYPRLFRGTLAAHPQHQLHRVRAVTIAAPGIVAYADGERLGPLPVRVECAPGALHVIA